jgi:hypothetical protein
MPASEAVGRRHGRYLDPVGVTLPSSQAETAAEAGADHRPAKITDAPLNRSREALLVARRSTSPMGPVGRCTDISSDSEVATADSTRVCSSCLMGLHLGKWSPRSDSNRRPSDYESDRNLPTGPVQDHPGCSGTGPIPSRPVLYRLVVTPGLPERLPPVLPGAGELVLIWNVDHPIAIGRSESCRPPFGARCDGAGATRRRVIT